MPRRLFLAPLLVLSAAAATLFLGAGVAEASTVTSTVRGKVNLRAGASTRTAMTGALRNRAKVTIAQAILESGWGRSGLTKNDRNFFGIKCFNNVHGPIANGCHTYATYECLPVCAPTTASFRTYASALDSFRDHGRFLFVNSRYLPAFAYTRDANQFLYQIWKAGYATSPTYYTNVKALMVRYNLYQYDLRV